MAEKTSIRKHLDSLGYSPTLTGLGSVANSVQAARQQNIQNQVAQQTLANQTQETGWNNPYRQVSELDKLKALGNPLQQALAQLIASVPKSNSPVTVNPSQPNFLTPQQLTQQNAGQGMAQANAAPVPVQKFDWLFATPDDLAGWQAEMKKRQASRTA